MKKFLRSGKYFVKIYLWTVIALLSILIIFSSIIYWNVEKSVTDNNYDLNKQILSQVANNVDIFDQTVKNLVNSIYLSSDTKAIMDMARIGDNYGETSAALDNLRKTYMSNNAYIHSIVIYNGETKVYASTHKGISESDAGLEDMVRTNSALPVLKPIYREVESLYPIEAKPTDGVFTYAMYDWLSEDNKPEDSIYVNIKADWMLENINRINTSNPKSKSNIYLLNGNGENIGNQNDDDDTRVSMQSLFSQYIEKANTDTALSFDSFITEYRGEKSYVSYIYLKRVDWVLVKVQPYHEIFQSVNHIKFIMLLITLLFIVIVIIASFAISRNIYIPIGRLVKQLHTMDRNGQDGAPINDEISFLNQMYNKYYEYRELYYNETRSKDRLLNNYYLTNLLVDSHSMTVDDISNALERNDTLFRSGGKLAVCVIRIDQYNQFVLKSNRDQELFRFAISNIMHDSVGEKFDNETIDMKKDQIVLIVNTRQAERDEVLSALSGCIEKAQSMINNYFKLTVSVSVGDMVESAVELEGSYRMALYTINYRLLFGRNSIITGENVQLNNENQQVSYDLQWNKKLTEAMKSGNLNQAEKVILSILDEIKSQNFNNMTLSIMHVTAFILNSLNEMNKSKLQPQNIDYNMYQFKMMDFESMDEISSELVRLISLGVGNTKQSNSEKHALIIETVKGIVEESYSDPSLSLQLVAGHLKMSSVYLGKIFKDNMTYSLSEYINGIRLEKAREMLENSNLPIVQIIEKVGMENESYFYKLFKKKYGVTPKEHVLKQTISKP